MVVYDQDHGFVEYLCPHLLNSYVRLNLEVIDEIQALHEHEELDLEAGGGVEHSRNQNKDKSFYQEDWGIS